MAALATLALRTCGLGMALALAGCGGALEELTAKAAGKQPVPPANAAAAAAIAQYCDMDLPDPATSPRDGWSGGSLNHVMQNGVSFEASGIASANGHSEGLDEPIWMGVGAYDYRNNTGPILGGAAAEGKMGVTIPTLLAPSATACVAQASKATYGYQQAGLAQLAWRSFWHHAVPVATLPGRPVDGFEFVSNFTPDSGHVLFQVSKSRFASPQGLTICHLGPNQQQWSCALPASADRGALWQLTQPGPRPGVYMLVAQ